MFDYLKNAVAKTVSNSLISLAGYVGGYSLVDPTDKHGVKNSHLLCKGKVICIPFYHGGHSCQVYLNFDRGNFEEVAYGVLFPDGKIIDITTGCPGLGSPLISASSFGPECQLIWSDVLHKFPEHLEDMNEDDYYLYGDATATPQEEPMNEDQNSETPNIYDDAELTNSAEGENYDDDPELDFYATVVGDPDSELLQ